MMTSIAESVDTLSDLIIVATCIYFLQETFTQDGFLKKYPVFDDYPLRVAVAAVAAGFAIELFKINQEVYMWKIGLAFILALLWVKYRRSEAHGSSSSDFQGVGDGDIPSEGGKAP